MLLQAPSPSCYSTLPTPDGPAEGVKLRFAGPACQESSLPLAAMVGVAASILTMAVAFAV